MRGGTNMGKLEWGIWIGWLTLIGAGFIFLSVEAFKFHWMLGVGFLILFAVGVMIGLLGKRRDERLEH